MAKTINERFMDFQIAQQIRWIRYMNKEVREALLVLNRVDAKLAATLQAADLDSGTFTQARLNALKVQITNIITQLHSQQLAPVLIENLNEAAILSAEIEGSAFARMLPAGLDVTTPNLGVLSSVATLEPFNGAVMDDWVTQLRTSDLNRTWRHILDGITSGTTTDDLIRSLNGTKSLRYKDGVRQVTRRGTEALVRTSINHATNQGRQKVWEANENLLRGVRWVATLDTRTTPICRERDGKVGPVSPSTSWSPPQGTDRLVPQMARPPAHVNCRSTTTAITKSWRELGFDVDEMPEGTRASMDGQVPANKTYFEWLSGSNVRTQKDALGPSRYRLWKDGGINPDRFQNDAGRLFSLEEMRKKMPQAFKDAEL